MYSIPAERADEIAHGLNEATPEPYDYRQDFWLARPEYSPEFAAEVWRRFTKHAEGWDGNTAVGEAVRKAYALYHGLHADTVTTGGGLASSPIISLTEAGEHGEFLRLFINQFRGLLRHQLALVTAERPAWDPQATTADSDSAKQVTLCRNLLDYLMDAPGKGFAHKLYEQQEIMNVVGAAFQALGWDARLGRGGKGGIWSCVLAPWEVAHERVREYEDCSYWIFRRMESRADWVAYFHQADPEKAKKIAGLESDARLMCGIEDGAAEGENDSDRIAVLYLYANPTLACPDGRLAIIAGEDLVLQDGPMPYGESAPITRVCAAQFLGTSVPYSNSWSQLAIADAHTLLLSVIMTRLDLFGVPDVTAPKGAEFDRGSIGGANLVEYTQGVERPQLLDLLNIPNALPGIADMLKTSMEELSGINSVTRGNPNQNISSGSMAALVQSMAVQFNSAEERTYTLNSEAIGTHAINIFKRCATEEQIISIAGQDQQWTTRKFKGEDLDQILRVAVKRTSPILKTLVGRKDIADQLLNAKLIQDPREYLKAVETGNLSPLFKSAVDELNNIKEENERMARGDKVVVSNWDNHQLHIREHCDELNGENRYDMNRRKGIEAHIMEHYTVWADLSRRAPGMLEARGLSPLSQEFAIGQQKMQAQTGAQVQQPSKAAPQKQPGTIEQKIKPGPEAAPKGHEPSEAAPSLPRPAQRSA